MLGFADLLARVAPAPPKAEAAEARGSAGKAAAVAAGTSAFPAPSLLGVSGLALSLLLLSAVFAYLWFSAGSSAGTLSRWAWYAAALAQGWLAILAVHAEAAGRLGSSSPSSSAKTFAMSPTGFLLAVLLGAPLLHATLFELLLHDADRGDLYTDATAWVGRVVAVAALVAAGTLYVRQMRGS